MRNLVLHAILTLGLAISFSQQAYARNPVSWCAEIYENFMTQVLGKSTGSVEIDEINGFIRLAKKLDKLSDGAFWHMQSEQGVIIEKLLSESKITLDEYQSLRQALGAIQKLEENQIQVISEILSLPGRSDLVGPTLRVISANGIKSSSPVELVNEFYQGVKDLCKPVTLKCKGEILGQLIGAKRRKISSRDLANRLKNAPGKNFEVVTDARLSETQALVIQQFLKKNRPISIEKSGPGWKAVMPEGKKLDVPSELASYLDKMYANIVRVSGPPKHVDIEVVFAERSHSIVPLFHQDSVRPGSVELLSSVKGSQPWVKGSDGRFFQAEAPGDGVFILPNTSGNGTEHGSPIDHLSDRILLRFTVRSERFMPV